MFLSGGGGGGGDLTHFPHSLSHGKSLSLTPLPSSIPTSHLSSLLSHFLTKFQWGDAVTVAVVGGDGGRGLSTKSGDNALASLSLPKWKLEKEGGGRDQDIIIISSSLLSPLSMEWTGMEWGMIIIIIII